MDEVGVVDELWVNLQQILHLLPREVAMDGVGAESSVVLAFQVLDDERGQVGNVGAF